MLLLGGGRVGDSTFLQRPDSLDGRRIGVNEFQLLREAAWRNAAQASSAVKCANWKLARESNSQFQTLLTETKYQVYGRIKQRRRKQKLSKHDVSIE